MARLKAIKEMIKNSRDEQTLDMFPDDLTKAKGAELKKTMLGQNKKKKKKRKKRVKKGEQTTMEFGAGGKIAKYLWKNKNKPISKLKEESRKKKLKEKKRVEKTETKSGPVTTFNPDAANVKKAKKIREEKQKAISDKINPKYAGGGKVKKETPLKDSDLMKRAHEHAKKERANTEKMKKEMKERSKNVKRHAGGGKVKTEREKAQQIVDEGYAKVKARREKAKRIVKGDMNPKKYAHGGTVRKSIDGIAQRGLTRAKHK